MTLPTRILRRITEQPNGCWEWSGTHNNHGYGMVWWIDRMRVTHQVVYELLVGPVPVGLELDHAVCQNKGCCNPAHLEPVTHAENMRRADCSRRLREQTECIRGHDLNDVGNIYRTKRGHRCCKPCRRTNQNERNARLREAVPA